MYTEDFRLMIYKPLQIKYYILIESAVLIEIGYLLCSNEFFFKHTGTLIIFLV